MFLFLELAPLSTLELALASLNFAVGLEICLSYVLTSPSINGKGAPSIDSPSSPRKLPLAR
ncbi:hypothetical protein F2Q69_00046017 [Brassica cretica]|uniref:Uncharacterized protein n=1 Tax=Brassica cretica TaxID=69181 RepID=A0A8S9Q196_BRACR|nr:hypothetical protein F2Q69_00046017 [Brassica cretica]